MQGDGLEGSALRCGRRLSRGQTRRRIGGDRLHATHGGVAARRDELNVAGRAVNGMSANDAGRRSTS